MTADSLINLISNRGIIIANRIRLGLAFFLSVLILSISGNNTTIINLTFGISLIIFFALSILSYLLTKKNRESLRLKIFTVTTEITIVSLIKIAHLFTDHPHLAANENVIFQFYWLFLILSLLQNRRSLSLIAGILVIFEYSAVVLISILSGIPTAVGTMKFDHIMLDNEIFKILLFAAFTAVLMIILKNLNAFSSEAVKNYSISEKRNSYLAGIIEEVKKISLRIMEIDTLQSSIGRGFTALADSQAAISDEMASSFEEITATTESISRSMNEQKEDGIRGKKLVEELNISQQSSKQTGESVLSRVSEITSSTEKTMNDFQDMLQNMSLVENGGREINNFVDIINDITDRINLLSLNASIEAARAGDAGRGFAVVADEISKLAAATSENSKEISNKINKITRDISEGIKITERSKNSSELIFENIKKIAEVIIDFNTAISRQEAVINDVADQTSQISGRANSIADTTSAQLHTMEENMKIVNNISEISVKINEYSGEIINISRLLEETSSQLGAVIENID